jgi:hypothetical protein
MFDHVSLVSLCVGGLVGFSLLFLVRLCVSAGKGQGLNAMMATPSIKRRQQGVVRVNCVDCLDRTNVAQFCVVKASLPQQVSRARTPGFRSLSVIGW